MKQMKSFIRLHELFNSLKTEKYTVTIGEIRPDIHLTPWPPKERVIDDSCLYCDQKKALEFLSVPDNK